MELKDAALFIAENRQLLEDLQVEHEQLSNDIEAAMQQMPTIVDDNIKLQCEIKEMQPLIVTEDELSSLKA